jgi:hypothetical protein
LSKKDQRENELNDELSGLNLERGRKERKVDDDSFIRYERLDLLGSGAFGHVFLVRDTKIRLRDENV